MKKYYYLFALVLGMALMGCQKTYESPEITETKVDIQFNSVRFTANVNYSGKAVATLELATLEDMSDKQDYVMDLENKSTFTTDVPFLEPYVDYYYRIIVVNGDKTDATPVKHFLINSDLLNYAEDDVQTRVGVTDGGTYEWAVMFPSSTLTPYAGSKITKVRFRVADIGQFTIKIYSGGTSSPKNLMKTKEVTIFEEGWYDVNLSPIGFPTSESLWVSLSCTHDAGRYPASAGYGTNNKNTRWRKVNSNKWGDAKDGLGYDLAWHIGAYVEYISNGSKGQCFELPQLPTSEPEGNVISVTEKPY